MRAGEGARSSGNSRLSSHRILRAATRHQTPWRNGGGMTTEVATFPPGAGMDDFVWRVSIAEVREAGPFSDFPGIDRTLSVLEGTLSLAVADMPEQRLDAAAAPFAFPADVLAWGAPIDGAVRDLNVMVRRGHCTAAVERLPVGTAPVGGGTATWLMIVATGDATVAHDTGIETLARFDAILFEGPIPEAITVGSDLPSFAIRLQGLSALIDIDNRSQ
ncbi:HutD family protein [Sphingomonas sp.]|uniref:HutD/Ves family protein n=1 Tax=Sphingomonas sp. TaxID=28214 RepID=UPI0035633A8C